MKLSVRERLDVTARDKPLPLPSHPNVLEAEFARTIQPADVPLAHPHAPASLAAGPAEPEFTIPGE
jgi:hypothetical protein